MDVSVICTQGAHFYIWFWWEFILWNFLGKFHSEKCILLCNYYSFWHIFHPISCIVLQNEHLHELLMDLKKIATLSEKGSKRCQNFPYGIWKLHRIFYLSSNFNAVFFVNWLHRELVVVCWHISSISYGFVDILNQKGPTKAEFRNLKYHI